MAQEEFCRRLGVALGISPVNRSELSQWERGQEDFAAVYLVAAEQVANDSIDERTGRRPPAT